MEGEVTKGFFSIWQSLSTTGMVILSITIITFVLAKFGVLNKIIDKQIGRGHFPINGCFNKEKMAHLEKSIEVLLQNDIDVKERLDDADAKRAERMERERQMAGTLGEVCARMEQVEKSQLAAMLENYKQSITDKNMLLIDRMAAGIKFLLSGGNSDTKKYILNDLAYEDLDMWNGLCRAMPGAMVYWQHRKGGK